ncbi:MAG TPA: DUF3108 domain-containing protein [Planctomycetota bacterium]|nr:DUF3108 domain-containing protein [Planctomycetota bacterium]
MFRQLLTAALLSAALSAPALAASAAVSAAEAVGAAKEQFPPFVPVEAKLTEGERLTYQIKWGAVDAGQAVLSVKRRERFGPDGAEVWNVQCETRSNAFVSMFYEVRDDIKTLIDVKEGFARHFDMKKNEGSFHGSEQIQFDYEKNLAEYTRTEKGTFADKVRNRKVSLPGKIHDPMSCLYYIRGLDLKPGSEHKLAVNTDRKNWVLTLKTLRVEEMFQKDLGALKALVVEPEAQFQGIFVRKGKMTVWLEESTKIPLMMKVDVPIGSVTATLVKAEGTPLTAKPGEKK